MSLVVFQMFRTFAVTTYLIIVLLFMEIINLTIKRRRTGASPETFRLWLNALSATAFPLLIQKLFSHDNAKSQRCIHGGSIYPSRESRHRILHPGHGKHLSIHSRPLPGHQLEHPELKIHQHGK